MKLPCVAFLVLLASPPLAGAATLYRWTDASGTHRYGYQPPPGVEAVPAEEERRELYDGAPPVSCRDLAAHHLAVVDKEIARVRSMKTGLGPEYELSPAAQQELILDLLAHRAALISGRPASEFRTPTSDEILRSRSRLQGENVRLRNELKSQEAIIDVQQTRLNRARREANAVYPVFSPWLPGYYPWVPGIVPVPIRR